MHQQQHMHELLIRDAGLMAASSLYYLWLALYSAAPPWTLVPPLCFGFAALWNAWTNHRQFHARREAAKV